jgi:hypothetical protein
MKDDKPKAECLPGIMKREGRPMATIEYQHVRRIVQALSQSEQRRLIAELSKDLQHADASVQDVSILELKGLGKEIWQGTDAQEYVDRERASWNG